LVTTPQRYPHITEEVEAFAGHMEDDEDGKDAAVRG